MLINNVRVYSPCILITGDNLGIHQICGLVESFSANYSCRVCKIHREELRSQTVQDPNLLRKSSDYEKDLKLDDTSKTGINEYCVWNDLLSYHLMENGVIIGDCIPESDEYWDLYLHLKSVGEIINLRYFNKDFIDFLKTLITEHHELYVELFGEKLKPKFHFLLHYPRITIHNIKYQPSMLITTRYKDHLPLFAEIVDILLNTEKGVFF